jgi:hypothetical protein
MQNLHWSDLADKSAEIRQGLIVIELANVELKSGYVEEGHADLVTETFDCQHKLRLVACAVWILVDTLGDDVADLAADTLLLFGILISLLPLLHLLRGLSLLDYSHLVSILN